MSMFDDARRAAEIARYGVLGHPPRRDLTALADVAAQVAGVPMATINLITETHQHQVAAVGFVPSICRRRDSMCRVTMEAAEPVIVPDASLDERFRDNPFVTGEIGDVRFYASHQLRTPTGVVIGTLCVFDTEPRELTADQARALGELADRVVDVLELELHSQRLERSNERLASFASQVSHDLREPLVAVSMALRTACERIDDTDEEVRQVLDRAFDATRRMYDFIDALLGYARVGGELRRERVDLGELVGQVCEDLAVALDGATVEVEELPAVHGDRHQLRAALQNLMANAAKFTRPGEPPRIEVGAVRVGTRLRVTVADHGPGLPADQRERVFEPFQRASGSTEGHGIGLATVRRVAQAHGGEAGAEDTPGGGATFWIELPA